MRSNATKRRLLEDKPVQGASVCLGAPLIGEMFSLAGCDYVIVDQQHGAWDDADTMQAIRGILLGSATPVVRVQKNDYGLIGRVLDQGALGVIVPMVNSVEEAEAVVYAARYPPSGSRSWGPFGAGQYGPEYAVRADDEVLVLVQIETRQAADNAEEILAVDGVDGCWIGPNDLGKSLGVDPGSVDGLCDLEAAIGGVLAACRKVGKIPGMWAGGVPKKRLDQGFLFVTITNDRMLIADGVKGLLEDLNGYRR